ncbi:MAG: hypothetical protein LIP06_03325 [Tannerellaceae bacterium]|nr:hypothetical protein [Tannerellaceae bacterium]
MRNVKKYLTFGLPLLFITYLGFLIAFTHVHIVNGVTIVHSHPYHLNHTSDGTPVEHEHTYAEFQLLHQLSVIEIAGAALVFFLLAALLAATQTLLYHPVYPDYLLPVTGKLSLRAPPVA